MDFVGKLKFADLEFDVYDDGETVKFVDFMTEARVVGGIVSIGLGTVVVDGDGPPRCNVACRLRMNMGSAEDLAKTLLQLVGKNLEAKEKAN